MHVPCTEKMSLTRKWSASFVVIMLVHEGLTHIHSQKSLGSIFTLMYILIRGKCWTYFKFQRASILKFHIRTSYTYYIQAPDNNWGLVWPGIDGVEAGFTVNRDIHPLFYGVMGIFAGANPSCLWASAGYTLPPLPAYHRALTDGRGCHTRCQLHIRSNLGFSILLKDTSTCSSAQPGAGIWTSNLPITSQPALPAQLQPLTETWWMKLHVLCPHIMCVCSRQARRVTVTTHLISFTWDLYVYLMGHRLSDHPAPTKCIVSLAPFILPFECRDPVPILCILLSVKVLLGLKFHCASVVPPEVVSEAQHWQCGAGACRSDGVHSVITKQIFHFTK